MKKPLLSGYTFQPNTRAIDFSAVSGFDIRGLFAVINLKSSILMYAVATPALGYSSISNGVVTLKYNTAAMAANDPLLIVYDNGDTASDVSIQAVRQEIINLSTAMGLDADATNAALGLPADTGATSDTGEFSLIALTKRSLTYLKTLTDRLPARGAAAKAASLPVTIATDQGNLEPGGVAITNTAMPAGGIGLTGWLSAIYSLIYNKTLYYAPTLFKGTIPAGTSSLQATLERSASGAPGTAPSPFSKYFVQGLADQPMELSIYVRQTIGDQAIAISREIIPAGTPFIRTVDVGFRSYQAALRNTTANAATDVTLTDGFKVA